MLAFEQMESMEEGMSMHGLSGSNDSRWERLSGGYGSGAKVWCARDVDADDEDDLDYLYDDDDDDDLDDDLDDDMDDDLDDDEEEEFDDEDM